MLVAVGAYIRLNVMETPEFARVKEANREAAIPFVSMLRDFPGNVIAGMGARTIDGVFFNVFAVFSIGYLTGTVKLPRTQALLGVTAAALLLCVTIPSPAGSPTASGAPRLCLGLAAHRLLGLSGLLGLPPQRRQHRGDLAGVIVPFGILYASVYGPEAALFSELFPARVRYTGISFVYQFSGIFASGLTRSSPPRCSNTRVRTGRGWSAPLRLRRPRQRGLGPLIGRRARAAGLPAQPLPAAPIRLNEGHSTNAGPA